MCIRDRPKTHQLLILLLSWEHNSKTTPDICPGLIYTGIAFGCISGDHNSTRNDLKVYASFQHNRCFCFCRMVLYHSISDWFLVVCEPLYTKYNLIKRTPYLIGENVHHLFLMLFLMLMQLLQ